ncbi:hypothetical protein [Leminorella grimontii]|uniref:hypothetical protein n=1 Tax=Leminorella grimontii TaxID=82981 RepID=UPI0020804A72|nr:hypothetical protein [Leminorella grimontii]GKX57901.1 hypothetical protein SOASR031_02160 [Leminorella grimontii]
MPNSQEDMPSGEIRFRIEIPAKALSYKEYLKGCSQVVMKARPPQPFSRLKSIASGAILGIAMTVGFQLLSQGGSIQLVASAWSYTKDDYLFYFDNAFSFFLLLFLSGGLAGVLWLRRQFLRQSKILYRTNDSIRDGCLLELTESGVCATSLINTGPESWRINLGWGKVSAVASDKNVDYIIFTSGLFLWIPAELEGYPRDEVLAFIRQKSEQKR